MATRVSSSWSYEKYYSPEARAKRAQAQRTRMLRLKREEQERAAKRKLAEKKKKQRQVKAKRDQETGFVKTSKQVVSVMPSEVRKLSEKIIADTKLSEGVEAMAERMDAFPTKIAAVLSGIAVHDASRDYFDEQLDAIFAKDQGLENKTFDEVIIGGGLHAAIYSAVRVAKGFKPPLVLERRRAGGAFAVSKQPSFYLNSRNRPGPLSLPGQDGSLNVLPGSPLQVSDLDGSEYQSNAALAWVIRATLAMSARVVTGIEVQAIDRMYGRSGRYYRIMLAGRPYIRAKRVIIATGLSDSRVTIAGEGGGDRAMSFDEMMARMDSKFPLRDMNRVAVIGAGDSGKTAIEALTGQGPASGWSVASVDWPSKIDWYGTSAFYDAGTFAQCNRSRYRGIARLLPTGGSQKPFRVRPIVGKAVALDRGYDCVYVDEKPYDHVVVCTGYRTNNPLLPTETEAFAVGGRIVARRSLDRDASLFLVGPAASIGLNALEQNAVGNTIPENATALFRYADRTATLAASLS